MQDIKLKNLVKNILGWWLLLIYLSNRRMRNFLISLCRIDKKPKNKALSILRTIFQDRSYHYLPLEERIQCQVATMGGKYGVNWMIPKPIHDNFPPIKGTKTIGNVDFHAARPFFEKIDQLIKEHHIEILIQIGCGTGQDIAYFAKKYSKLFCIGTEIINDLIPHLNNTWSSDNLKFIYAYAHKTFEYVKAKKNIIIFSNASLQYVQPEHLKEFFKQFSKTKYSHLVLCESGHFHKKNPTDINGSTARGCFSWTHNYNFYAKLNHCKMVNTAIIKPYIHNKKHCFTCHYFAHYSS